MHEFECQWCLSPFDIRMTGIYPGVFCSEMCRDAERRAKLRFIDRRLEDGRITFSEIREDEGLDRKLRNEEWSRLHSPTSDAVAAEVSETPWKALDCISDPYGDD